MSTLSTLTSSYLQSILPGALQGVSQTNSTTSLLKSSSLNQSSLNPASLNQTADSDTISPFGKLVLAFRHLQQSNPAQYQQLTSQIATKLQTAADTATSNGNTKAATVLNQLSSDFSTASQSGQLPNFPDLAKAIVAHRHQDHYEASPADGGSPGSGSATQIVLNTLAKAGISL